MASRVSTDGVSLSQRRGAQDGAAKTGSVHVRGAHGAHANALGLGSVECFGYGAQRGRFYVRAEPTLAPDIRLSGAEVLFGGDCRLAFEYRPRLASSSIRRWIAPS